MLQFKFDLMEDFIRARRQRSESDETMVLDLSYNDLLCDLRSRIAEVGLTMVNFGLDEPDESLQQELPSSDEQDESIDAQLYYDNNRSKLTDNQERLFGIIASHIDNSSGGRCSSPDD